MAGAFLLRFRADLPPRGLAHLVAARAVVVPLRGVRSSADVPAASLKVVDCWRARVRHLGRLGWHMLRAHGATRKVGDAVPAARVGSRKWRMLNCPPSAVVVAPKGLPCMVPAICPNCWGRWAAEQWRAVDRSLFGRPRPPGRGRLLRAPRTAAPRLVGTSLVLRDLSAVVPFFGADGRRLLPEILDRRVRRGVDPGWDASVLKLPGRDPDLRGLRAAGAKGGLEVIQVRPVASKVGGDLDSWRVSVFQVIAVATEDVEAFVAHPKVLHTSRVRPPKVVDAPTRGQLALAVARACRYPRYLLHGDGQHALATLYARRHRRLSTRFGCCYGHGG